MSDFYTFNKDLNSKVIDNLKIVIFTGSENYIKKSFLEKIKTKYLTDNSSDFNLNVITSPNKSQITKSDNEDIENKIISSVKTPSFLGGKKITLIKDFSGLDRFSLDVNKIIDNIANDSLLLIIADEDENKTEDPKKNKIITGEDFSFIKGIKKIFERKLEKQIKIYDFSKLNKDDFKIFVNQKISEILEKENLSGKLEFLDDEINYFINSSDYLEDARINLSEIFENLHKIILSAVLKVKKENIDEFIEKKENTDNFLFIESIKNKNIEELFDVYLSMNEEGKSIYTFLTLLLNELMLILGLKEAILEGLDNTRIIKRLGIKEFRLKYIKAFAGKFEAESLRKTISLLLDIDYKIKSGLLDETSAFLIFLTRYVKI